MPIFAEAVLHAGPRGLGLLLSAPAAGAVVCATVLGVIRLPNRAGLGVLVAVGLYGACLFGFGMSHNLWFSTGFLAGSGAADSISMTLRHGIRTLLTPDGLRGRVAAVQRTLGAGGPQLGEFEAGVVASFAGVGPTVAFGGVATVLTGLVVAKLAPQIVRFKLSAAVQAQLDEASPSSDRITSANANAD